MKDLETLPKLHIRGTIAPREVAGAFGETVSATDVLEFLESTPENEIVVEISSNGGSVTEAKEIYARLKNSGKKITTITYVARSAATIIMLAGQKRLIVESADVLIHPARVFPEDLGLGALLAEDLIKIGLEVEKATEDILNIYCKVLGEEKRTALLAAMTNDMDLSPKEVIRLGFAQGYYKKDKKEIENCTPILITDHLESIIKNTMSKEQDASKLEQLITNGFKAIAKMFAATKNEAVVETDKGPVYIQPADPEVPGEYAGAKVFKVDEAGIQTAEPVDDGDYKLPDGTVLTVEGGVVTNVAPVVDANKLKEELEAQKQTNKEQAEQLVAKDQEIQALKTQMESVKEDMTAKFTEIQNAFNEFKKEVPGDRKAKKEDEKDPEPDYTKMSRAQLFIHNRKEQLRLQKK